MAEPTKAEADAAYAGAALNAPKLPTAGLYHFPNDGQLWRTSPLTGVPDGAEGLYTAEQVRSILANHSGVALPRDDQPKGGA